jgi:hypothetical protein
VGAEAAATEPLHEEADGAEYGTEEHPCAGYCNEQDESAHEPETLEIGLHLFHVGAMHPGARSKKAKEQQGDRSRRKQAPDSSGLRDFARVF